MKRIIACILLTVMLLTPTGCRQRTKVGLCLRERAGDWAAWMEHSLRTCLTQAGFTVISRSAANDQSRQNSQISELLEEGCSLLVVEPVMTAAAGDILRQAKDGEVPVILTGYQPAESVLAQWDRACYIGSDLTEPGLLESRLIRQLPDGGDRNGDGNVAYTVISGPAEHMDAARWIHDWKDAVPGICLSEDHGDWSYDSGKTLCARQLSRFGGQTEVIFCCGDMLVQGALEALSDQEQTDVYLVGIGGGRMMLEQISAGNVTGTVCPDVPGLTDKIAETARILLSDGTPEPITLLDFALITRENAALYLQE